MEAEGGREDGSRTGHSRPSVAHSTSSAQRRCRSSVVCTFSFAFLWLRPNRSAGSLRWWQQKVCTAPRPSRSGEDGPGDSVGGHFLSTVAVHLLRWRLQREYEMSFLCVCLACGCALLTSHSPYSRVSACASISAYTCSCSCSCALLFAGQQATEESIRAIFTKAKRSEPSFLIFDDMDFLLSPRASMHQGALDCRSFSLDQYIF